MDDLQLQDMLCKNKQRYIDNKNRRTLGTTGCISYTSLNFVAHNILQYIWKNWAYSYSVSNNHSKV